MRFTCSINREVRAALGPSGKIPAGGKFGAFNDNWIASSLSSSELADEVMRAHGICAWHLVNGQRKSNSTGAIKAGLVIIDIDNQADGKDAEGNKIQDQQLTPEQALELPICQKYLSLAYFSPSTADGWLRFRLVFGLESEILDPDFYQWFVRTISESIPGSDRRATQAVNLFYGAHPEHDPKVFYYSDKAIPQSKVTEAYQAYVALPKEARAEDDPASCLTAETASDGIDITDLVSTKVRDMLDGFEVEDRSASMAVAFKELIGWSNWLREKDLKCQVSPEQLAELCFENIYQYAPALDGKYKRILNSIYDPATLLPSVALASDDGDLAVWRKVKRVSRETFLASAPESVQAQLKPQEKARNSILTFDFEPSTSTTTSTPKPKEQPMASNSATPQTPAQLVSLQGKKKQFSENDVADVIVSNNKDTFLFDSSLDEFFCYDEDEGVWYLQDSTHIKRRIIKALDVFVTSGVIPKYSSATVNSVYQLLQGKLLRSSRGGRNSIWSANRGLVPFKNGALDSQTGEFLAGFDPNQYIRNRLPYDYDPSSQCPKFVAWLTDAIGKDRVKIIQAFSRAVLTSYTQGERFLHLVGPGGTGKSTLQQVLTALVGLQGLHTTSLEQLETNKFECFSLIGKKLVVLTDESSYSKRMDTMKKLTSASDTLRAERKYGKEVISFKPECLVCIASNEHISSSDTTSGLERRRLTIVMDKVVPASKRRDLLNVYQDRIEGELEPELSGIVTWALSMDFDTMRDVLANPVKHCPDLRASDFESLLFNNPFAAWLNECTLYAPGKSTKIGGGAFKPSTDESERGMFFKNAYTELYASYCNFCKSNGYKAAARERFSERLKETLSNVLKLDACKRTINNGFAVFTGLILKPFDISTSRAAYGDTRLPTPVEYASNPQPDLWKLAFEEHAEPPVSQ
jgi:P4 family phage/plasmid primase-like protien